MLPTALFTPSIFHLHFAAAVFCLATSLAGIGGLLPASDGGVDIGCVARGRVGEGGIYAVDGCEGRRGPSGGV